MRFPIGDAGAWVPYAVGLLLLEFVILHSSVFVVHTVSTTEDSRKRTLTLIGLTAFYGLMALGFALSTQSPSLVAVFAAVLISRLWSTWGADAEAVQYHKARSVVGIMAYMGAITATLFLPVPELGITEQVLNEVYPNRGTGVWERSPERAIAAGVLYFSALGLAELFVKFDRIKTTNA